MPHSIFYTCRLLWKINSDLLVCFIDKTEETVLTVLLATLTFGLDTIFSHTENYVSGKMSSAIDSDVEENVGRQQEQLGEWSLGTASNVR